MGAGMAMPPGPLRFVLMILLVLLAVAATTLGIAFLVPDGNDYARASVLKYQRLASLQGPKIVVIGGSNLAYGIDSAMLEKETKCQVANMGMNGHLGARFMLEEATPYLKKSDIVVISFEYQNFYNRVDGVATDQFMLAKANPEAWSHLTLQQKWDGIAGLPLVAQQKIFRLARSMITWGESPQTILNEKIETLAGFNEYGDLIAHLELEWPFGDTDRFDLSGRKIDPDIIPLLQSFAARMRERGVSVVYSYSPLQRDFYEEHKKAIADLHERLAAAAPLVVVHPPETLAYDRSMFFDSIYHLNAKGRAPRSKQLATDIRRAVLNGGDCATGPL